MNAYAYLIFGLMLLVIVVACLPPRRRSSEYITCHKCGKNTLEVVTRKQNQADPAHVSLVTSLQCHNPACNYTATFEDDKHWSEHRRAA